MTYSSITGKSTYLPMYRVKVAFVDEQIQQLEMNKFTETVIYNRGGKGRVFADMKEAEHWLLEQDD